MGGLYSQKGGCPSPFTLVLITFGRYWERWPPSPRQAVKERPSPHKYICDHHQSDWCVDPFKLGKVFISSWATGGHLLPNDWVAISSQISGCPSSFRLVFVSFKINEEMRRSPPRRMGDHLLLDWRMVIHSQINGWPYPFRLVFISFRIDRRRSPPPPKQVGGHLPLDKGTTISSQMHG